MRILDVYVPMINFMTEAQNYESMFNDLLTQHPNDQNLHEQLKLNIDWARKTLKKNDRIVWFLRWVKVFLSHPIDPSALMHARMQNAFRQQGQEPEQTTNPALAAYNQRYKATYTEGDLLSLQRLRDHLTHFFGLPISEIQNYVFRSESPREIYETFHGYEQAWRQRMEEEASLISPEDDDEILLQFEDGYAWWLLSRGACDVEAKAMGHCGNVPSERRGDRILSLRRLVQRGEKQFWYPVATFILDERNLLGEMKGRNNDKPIEKYHPYIIELLKHDMIEGIKGGGYMPANNFSMNDLDPQTREELIAQKSGLASFYDFYQKEGMTDRVMDMLSSKMSEVGLPEFESYDAQTKEFVVDTYRDLETFVRQNDDDILKRLFDLRERAADAQESMGKMAQLRDDQIYQFLNRLPDQAFAEIAKSLGINPTTPKARKMVAYHLDRQRGDLYYRIDDAFRQAFDTDLLPAVDARIAEYVDIGWGFECSHVWLTLDDQTNIYSSQVSIRIREQDLIEMTDSTEDDDNEYGWEAQRVSSENSWDSISWDNTNEYREEKGLITSQSHFRDYADVKFPDPDHMQFDLDDMLDLAVDAFVSGRSSPTINDPRQMQMALPESFFTELRRLAGIG